MYRILPTVIWLWVKQNFQWFTVEPKIKFDKKLIPDFKSFPSRHIWRMIYPNTMLIFLIFCPWSSVFSLCVAWSEEVFFAPVQQSLIAFDVEKLLSLLSDHPIPDLRFIAVESISEDFACYNRGPLLFVIYKNAHSMNESFLKEIFQSVYISGHQTEQILSKCWIV